MSQPHQAVADLPHRAPPTARRQAMMGASQMTVAPNEQRSFSLLVTLALLTVAVAAGWFFFAEPLLTTESTAVAEAKEEKEKEKEAKETVGALYLTPVADALDLRLTVEEVAALPDGQTYHAWIRTTDNRLFDLGSLTLRDGGATQQLVAPENLLASMDTLLLSVEESTTPPQPSAFIAASGQVDKAHTAALQQLLIASDTPLGKPLLAAAEAESTVAQLHTEMLRAAVAAGNLAAAQQHAEHVINILDGERGELFGDLNGDGQVQNPGDGVGVRIYLAQIHATLAASTIDTEALLDLETAVDAVTAALTVARQMTAADTLEEVAPLADALATQLATLLTGSARDGSGTINPTRKKGTTESVVALPVVSLQRNHGSAAVNQ